MGRHGGFADPPPSGGMTEQLDSLLHPPATGPVPIRIGQQFREHRQLVAQRLARRGPGSVVVPDGKAPRSAQPVVRLGTATPSTGGRATWSSTTPTPSSVSYPAPPHP